MTSPDISQPIDPKSTAWCGDCGFKAWGIWAHKKAGEHFAQFEHLGPQEGHIVYVNTPNTEEDDRKRDAAIARAEQVDRETEEALERKARTANASITRTDDGIAHLQVHEPFFPPVTRR
ncbi:hypothetical protein HOT31_gp018 [Microbacterium phage Hendrix]|uniref:Uncharacterized protein n=1 Tax=Microbacterium phage Hendrix TaxID=2182341 RepID=A0A2U8UU92_9CAUD|nr:hypothetical protein HOT31_gp018 [Microbacterium phage Hendrix]AWN07689.1 hypothetical protein PBI_HENDRIX_18 [Microbacterium phage Hendrix]